MLRKDDGDHGLLSQIPHFDKVVHFGLFFVWAALGQISLFSRATWGRLWVVGGVFLLALAGGSEWLQRYVEGRQADFADFIVDVLGGVAGAYLTKYWKINQ
ncbi:VanZ family protein [Reichenbachiella sp. 5M10]|uniref:VanZ family protein n=1 Tax=Reichenbachiella sp. 5M10 TaxID=1889772 RepID=UPI001304594A|nr:VanZ family protein [Reichenbachiella sp. 5M10]